MGVIDAPAWLRTTWEQSVASLGATAGSEQVAAIGERLLEDWAAPDRGHQTRKRLGSVIAKVDELAGQTHDPDLIRLAAFYLGVVYRPLAAYHATWGVDAAASAERARADLTALGVPAAAISRIAEIIEDAADHEPNVDDIDAQTLSDADLGMLACTPQKYQAYVEHLRLEKAKHLKDDGAHCLKRIGIIDQLLLRPQLFYSPLAQEWERAARENLSAERQRLAAESETHGTSAPSAPAAGGGRQEKVQRFPRTESFGAPNQRPGLAPVRPAREAEAAAAAGERHRELERHRNPAGAERRAAEGGSGNHPEEAGEITTSLGLSRPPISVPGRR